MWIEPKQPKIETPSYIVYIVYCDGQSEITNLSLVPPKDLEEFKSKLSLVLLLEEGGCIPGVGIKRWDGQYTWVGVYIKRGMKNERAE